LLVSPAGMLKVNVVTPPPFNWPGAPRGMTMFSMLLSGQVTGTVTVAVIVYMVAA